MSAETNENTEILEATEKEPTNVVQTPEFLEMSKEKLFNIVVSGQGAKSLDDAVVNIPFVLEGVYISEDIDGVYALFGQGGEIIKTRSHSLINALSRFLQLFGEDYNIKEVKLIRKKASNSENRYYTLEVVENG